MLIDASTLDTHMNWGASYWANDLYDRLLCKRILKREPRRKELVLVARLSAAALILIALAIVPLLDSIQQAWKLSLLFGAGVGAVLVLRWLWERINVWCEIVAIAVSIAAAPVLLHFFNTGDEEWLRLIYMALISTAAVVATAFIAPATDHATLDRFYTTVRPPGFWRRTAARCAPSDRPTRTLARQFALVAAASGSLFLTMYGIGRLMLPHPDVHIAWPVAALAAGLALLPLWIGSLRTRHDDAPPEDIRTQDANDHPSAG